VWRERESKRMMCWGRSTCRRHQCTSDQARSRRGPMLILVVMSQWRWSIGVVRPNDGGSLYGAPFFTVRGLELSGSSRKKWLLVASKPPITKLKDCPCSIHYGGELCSFRVVIYCMLAMGPGQLYTLFFWYSQSLYLRYSCERGEKRRVLLREVRLTQDIYPMYSQSSKARKNNKGASLGEGKCQLIKCNPLATKLVGTPSISLINVPPLESSRWWTLAIRQLTVYISVIQLHSMDLRSLLCPIALN